MNKADVRPHSHGVNESMTNTDSDKKQSTKLRKHQQKRSVTTGRKKKKNKTVVFIMDIKNQFQLSRRQIFQSIESSCPQALFH